VLPEIEDRQRGQKKNGNVDNDSEDFSLRDPNVAAVSGEKRITHRAASTRSARRDANPISGV
jgi:hypothetical protein